MAKPFTPPAAIGAMLRHWMLAWTAAQILAVPMPAQATGLRLRLLETNCNFGLAKTATLIQTAFGKVKNLMLFDNSNLIQGSPLGGRVARVKPLAPGQVHPAYKVLNWLSMDAANIGNHEFNCGLPSLRQAIVGANFPCVNANVQVDAGPGLDITKAPHVFTPM